MDRKREKRGMQCYMKKEDNSLIDVESAETTGERCRHLSWRTPLNSSLCTFIGMKHISPTFMYIIPMYLRLTTFTKTLPQMSFHLYFFAIFISLWGSTHDSADCWSAHRSSAARGSFKRVHDWCKAGWRRPGGVIFFPINAPGMGRFQLLNLGVLGYGLELRFWVVIAIIVSLTLTITLITTLTII